MKKFALIPAIIAMSALTACSGASTSQTSQTSEVSSSSDNIDFEVTSSSESEKSSTHSEDVPSATRDLFAMDTYMTITCYGEKCEEALEASVNEINRLDKILSVGNSESEIYQLNNTGTVTFSDDTAAIVEKALEIYKTTNGAFDITVYPLMELWGFTTEEYKVPSEDEIKETLTHVNSDYLTYDENTKTMTLGNAKGIDLGGIAKGFTSDRLMEIFKEYDLVSGVVSLGGNVEVYRTKVDGTKWNCGIQNPLDPTSQSSFVGTIRVSDEAVITSGAYERYFTVDNTTGEITGAFEDENIEESDDTTTYHHIIDPKTGYPAETNILSVSIVSKSGVLADGLSTSCFVKGLDGAIEYWREYGDDFDFIIMTDDNEVYITENIEDRFSSTYNVNVITKEESDE